MSPSEYQRIWEVLLDPYTVVHGAFFPGDDGPNFQSWVNIAFLQFTNTLQYCGLLMNTHKY